MEFYETARAIPVTDFTAARINLACLRLLLSRDLEFHFFKTESGDNSYEKTTTYGFWGVGVVPDAGAGGYVGARPCGTTESHACSRRRLIDCQNRQYVPRPAISRIIDRYNAGIHHL
jgi:hypothetical protein